MTPARPPPAPNQPYRTAGATPVLKDPLGKAHSPFQFAMLEMRSIRIISTKRISCRIMDMTVDLFGVDLFVVVI
jgi:hypothetical protein